MVAVPCARPSVQHPRTLGVGDRELVSQQLPEQVVVAVPLPLGVEGDEEEVRPLELAAASATAPGRSVTASHKGAQRRSSTDVWSRKSRISSDRPGQHLRAQVVDDVAVVARERLDELVRAGPVPDGQRRQVEAGRPSLGQLAQPDDVVPVEPEPVQPVEEEVGVLLGEAQLLRVDLGQLAAGAEPRQRKRGLGTARRSPAATVRGRCSRKVARALVDLRAPDQVVVVEHQHDLVGQRGELVEEHRKDVVDHVRPRSPQQGKGDSPAPGSSVRSAWMR